MALTAREYPDFRFVPALSQPAPGDGWDGEIGFIHDVVARYLRGMAAAGRNRGEIDAYTCGPPPMIDAVLPVLQMNGVMPERVYFDKFTPSLDAGVRAAPEPGGLPPLSINQ